MPASDPISSRLNFKRHSRWLLLAFFVALSYYAASNLMQKAQEREDARQIRSWTEAGVVFKRLAHELQKERGLSSGYIAAQGSRFGPALHEQYDLTDSAIAELQTVLQGFADTNAPIAIAIRQSIPDGGTLIKLRQSVGELKLSRDAVVDYYTGRIDILFEQLLATMSMGRVGWIYRQQMAFVFFLQAKEMAGQERALVTAMLSSADFSAVRMAAYHRIKSVEEARLEKFLQLAEDEAKAHYRQIMSQPYVVQAERIRRLVAAIGASQEASSQNLPDVERWFALASAKIEAMGTLENVLSVRLLQSAQTLENRAQHDLIVNIITVLISFILAGALLLEILRGKQRAEETLQLAAAVFSNSVEAITITDREMRIIEVNAAFTRLTGYAREDVIGKETTMFRSERHPADFYQAMLERVERTGSWEGEIWNRRKEGDLYPALLSIVVVKNVRGDTTNYISTMIDLSQRLEAEALLDHLRTFDSLTGLPNRDAWLSALDRAVDDAQRTHGSFALLKFGLDRFKLINESLGHAVGDLVLMEVAKRLKGLLRRHDTLARLGGDRFSIVLPDIAEPQAAGTFCEKILAALAPPIQIGAHTFTVSASIGAVFYPDDGADVRTLRQNVDSALYSTKEIERGGYSFYSTEMNAESTHLLTLERMLRQALERNEFSVHYQPQVTATDGRLTGVEALLRWTNPELGMVSPVQFIPIAEETGLIFPIGEWVLRESCRQAQVWNELLGGDLPVAVNLSARQFRRHDLMATVQLILDETGLPGRLLELEITEGVLMHDPAGTTVLLDGLQQMGIRIALDDFGTGYSSLAYLKNFPIDRLKIDRAFVMGLPDDHDDMAISRAVIALGRNLGMEVLAEGVETQAQADFLATEGCQLFQGYHFGKPMPAAELTSRIQSGHYRL